MSKANETNSCEGCSSRPQRKTPETYYGKKVHLCVLLQRGGVPQQGSGYGTAN